MSNLSFLESLRLRALSGKDVCLGLDPVFSKIPKYVRDEHLSEISSIEAFCEQIINETCDLVLCYKPNLAFFECYGPEGMATLARLVKLIHSKGVTVIGDAKVGDIGNTNEFYAKKLFGYYGFDAITVSPYPGLGGLKPFLEYKDKGIIVLCRMSNSGADEFQNLPVEYKPNVGYGHPHKPVYQIVAENVCNSWDYNSNCLLVVGATAPDELQKVREIAGKRYILVPGIGTQGGDLEKVLRVGVNSESYGLIINSSSGILYSSSGEDFAKAARSAVVNLQTEINKINFVQI